LKNEYIERKVHQEGGKDNAAAHWWMTGSGKRFLRVSSYLFLKTFFPFLHTSNRCRWEI